MAWNKSTKETAKRNERRKKGWKRNVKSVRQMTGRSKYAGCKEKEKIFQNTAEIAEKRAESCREKLKQVKETVERDTERVMGCKEKTKSLKNAVETNVKRGEDCKIKEEKRRCSMVVELISVGT